MSNDKAYEIITARIIESLDKGIVPLAQALELATRREAPEHIRPGPTVVSTP